MPRGFLFLQGPASPLFARLADRLKAHGERVFRLNFCAGDDLYSSEAPTWRYRGALQDLPEYLAERTQVHRITDLVLFCEKFPVHRSAIAFAQREKLRLHIFDEGFVRPNWVTLQRGPVHPAHTLPRDPEWYLDVNSRLPDPGEGVRVLPAFAVRAAHDMAYHGANLANLFLYPGYRTHRPFGAAVEYAAWAHRYARFPWWLQRDAARIAELAASGAKYFFFPLQLNADAQLERNSPFGTMRNAIEHVLASFARHAPAQVRLVVKNHPLDTGLPGYRRQFRELARAFDLEARLDYLETGRLATLFDHAQGVVTVNSTAGLSALQHRRPTKALGRAVYDLPRLTFQGELDEFWSSAWSAAPDMDVVRAFRNVLVHATQVNGGFYTATGIDTLLPGCERLVKPLSRLEDLLERFPDAATAAACKTPALS